MSEIDNKRKSRSDDDQIIPPKKRSNNDDDPVNTEHTSDALLSKILTKIDEIGILKVGLENLFKNQKTIFGNQSKIFKAISIHHNYGVNNIVQPIKEMSRPKNSSIDELNIKEINQLTKTEAVDQLTAMKNSNPNEFQSLLKMMQFIDGEKNKPAGTMRPIDMHIKDSPGYRQIFEKVNLPDFK